MKNINFYTKNSGFAAKEKREKICIMKNQGRKGNIEKFHFRKSRGIAILISILAVDVYTKMFIIINN